ncbi:MAG: hypothetical protein F7B95_01380 [Desulfurococcales archaeon]|nr:hypothetical protein [Desulfurococcales archaeon]
MCMTPAGEEMILAEEARLAFRKKDLEKLKRIRDRLKEIKASPHVIGLVEDLIKALERES